MALTKYNYNSFDLTTAASKGLAFNSSANGFETAAEGSMILIKTLTASSSSTISFVNGTSDVVLNNTYPIYLFKFINVHPASNDVDLTFNGSADTGSNYNVTKTTSFFHAYHDEADNNTSLGYDTSPDLAQSTAFQVIHQGVGNGNDNSSAGFLYLYDPSNTTFVKHFTITSNRLSSGGFSVNTYVAGYFNTTSAIDAIQFKMSSGNMDAGTIKLYGIKDS